MTQYWKRYAHLLRGGLLQRVDELSVSDYPAETPNEVIRFLQDFLKELEVLIDKTTSEEKLQAFSALVQTLAHSLDWLDNAHTGQTPRGLVKVLKDLFDHMAPGSRVVARPQAEYNYSIADLGAYFQRLVNDYIPASRQCEFTKHLSTPLKLISFPRIERDNLLAHAIFGHELGHPIAAEFLMGEEIDDAWQGKQTEIQKVIAKLVDDEAAGEDGYKKLEIASKIFDCILQVRQRAIQELVSDAVGILIFGPSAFFAMFELLWSGAWDTKPAPDEWYPPSRMRVRLMLNLMDELNTWDPLWALEEDPQMVNYVRATKQFVNEARLLVSETQDQSDISGDIALNIAYDWMRSNYDEAISYAKTKANPVSFSPAKTFHQLPELIRRIELGIPPNEVGNPIAPDPVDYRASLLAAWIFKLRGVNPKNNLALNSKEFEALHMQTMRAVEYVILQTQYADHMSDSTNKGLAE